MTRTFPYFGFFISYLVVFASCTANLGDVAKAHLRRRIADPSATLLVTGKAATRVLAATHLTRSAGVSGGRSLASSETSRRLSVQCVSDALLESVVAQDIDNEVTDLSETFHPTDGWKIAPADSPEGKRVTTLAEAAFRGEPVDFSQTLVRCEKKTLSLSEICLSRPLQTLTGMETEEAAAPLPGNHTCNCEVAGLAFAPLTQSGCWKEATSEFLEPRRDPCTGYCDFRSRTARL